MVARAWVNRRGHAHTCSAFCPRQDDEVVLQCVACIQKENRKFCLAAEGLGNRLCYLEPTSEAKVGQTRRLLHALSPPPPPTARVSQVESSSISPVLMWKLMHSAF